MNPSVIDEMNLLLETEGVAVTDPGRFGARLGLRRGDVLLAINGEKVDHPREVETLLSRRARVIDMVIQRGASRTVLRFRG